MRCAVACVGRQSGASRRRCSRAIAAAGLPVLIAGLAGCGAADDRPVAPAVTSAARYASLGDADRLAAAERCRELIASRARGVAARQIAAVKPELLRAELDVAAAVEERATFRAACETSVPMVTPGLEVRFDGVTGNGRSFAYPTRSDRPLTISGRIQPPVRGRVLARREVGRRHPGAATIGPDGRFAFRNIELRKMADNSFLVRIDAPPNAPRVVRFSALCLDCGAGAGAGAGAVAPAP